MQCYGKFAVSFFHQLCCHFRCLSVAKSAKKITKGVFLVRALPTWSSLHHTSNTHSRKVTSLSLKSASQLPPQRLEPTVLQIGQIYSCGPKRSMVSAIKALPKSQCKNEVFQLHLDWRCAKCMQKRFSYFFAYQNCKNAPKHWKEDCFSPVFCPFYVRFCPSSDIFYKLHLDFGLRSQH